MIQVLDDNKEIIPLKTTMKLVIKHIEDVAGSSVLSITINPDNIYVLVTESSTVAFDSKKRTFLSNTYFEKDFPLPYEGREIKLCETGQCHEDCGCECFISEGWQQPIGKEIKHCYVNSDSEDV